LIKLESAVINHFAAHSLGLITATHEKLKIPQATQDNKPWSKRPAALFIPPLLFSVLCVYDEADMFAQSYMHVVGGTVFPEQTDNDILLDDDNSQFLSA